VTDGNTDIIRRPAMTIYDEANAERAGQSYFHYLDNRRLSVEVAGCDALEDAVTVSFEIV
jgi:hypothetical protein